jgi:hydroxymethylbilane synthase
MARFRIGTRGSKLALWQAEHVAEQLAKAGHEYEIVIIETKGDKVLDVSIAKIGSKGVFTEELEEQLATGSIDMAVHSAKDMQSRLPAGFEILAFMEREKVNDVILSHRADIDLNDPQKSYVIGTSSTRRVALFKHFYPHLQTVEVRGNLQTRIRKMEEGHCDALALAYAGVHRMGYTERIRYELPLSEFIPAVGQGSVAIEVHSSLAADKKEIISRVLNHSHTAACLHAERAYLSELEGGCSIPVFALATLENDTINLKGGIVSLDGAELIHKSLSGSIGTATDLGKSLAKEVVAAGGGRILKEIKGSI